MEPVCPYNPVYGFMTEWGMVESVYVFMTEWSMVESVYGFMTEWGMEALTSVIPKLHTSD